MPVSGPCLCFQVWGWGLESCGDGLAGTFVIISSGQIQLKSTLKKIFFKITRKLWKVYEKDCEMISS